MMVVVPLADGCSVYFQYRTHELVTNVRANSMLIMPATLWPYTADMPQCYSSVSVAKQAVHDAPII